MYNARGSGVTKNVMVSKLLSQVSWENKKAKICGLLLPVLTAKSRSVLARFQLEGELQASNMVSACSYLTKHRGFLSGIPTDVHETQADSGSFG